VSATHATTATSPQQQATKIDVSTFAMTGRSGATST
jgi:hypothetical protein